MKRVLFVLGIALACAAAAQDNLPPPFPRLNATKLLENDRIVIWDIVWPNGQPTALHRHVYDQVGTYYASGGRRITQPDGTSRTTMTEVGAISTTRKGTTHIEEGNTDSPLRAVFIELKQATPASPTSGGGSPGRLLPSGDAKPAFDDERVRVRDVATFKGAEAALRGEPGGTVVVFLGSGRITRTGSDGRMEEVSVEPGTMRYIAPGGEERQTVVEGAPRMMVFELK